MGDPSLVVRVAANLSEMKANLSEGVSQIETYAGALRSASAAYDGSRIIQQASASAAAIQNAGGVTALTTAELVRANAVFADASAKLDSMGKGGTYAAQTFQTLAAQTGALLPPLAGAQTGATELRDALLLAFDHPIYALRDLTKGISNDLVGALGVGAIEAGVAAAAIGGALVLVGKELYDVTMHAAETGESIYDASLKMSASVPAVSQLKLAAEVAGGSLEQVGSLIFVMQERMAKNPDEFEKGLKQVHLSLQAIAALDPDQRFLAISKAIRASGDETNRQAVAMDLFGRQGREGLTLLMKPLDELVQKSKDLGFTWTETDAKAADDLRESTRLLDAEWQKLKTDIGVELLPALQFLTDHVKDTAEGFYKGADGGTTFSIVVAGLKTQIDSATVIIDRLLGRAVEVPKVTGDAAKGMREWTQSVADRIAKAPTIEEALFTEKEAIRDLEQTRKQMNEDAKKAEEERRKAEAEADAIAMTGYANRIRGMQEVTKASLAAYGFGAQIAALDQLDQAEYAHSKAVFEALTSERDRAKVVEETTKRHIELMTEEQQIQERQKNVVNAAILATFDAQVKLNAEWGLNAAGALALQTTAADKLRLGLEALHAVKVAGVSQAPKEQALYDQFTKQLYDEAVAQDAASGAIQQGTAVTDAAAASVTRLSGTLVTGISNLDQLNAALSAFYDQFSGNETGIMGIQDLGMPNMQNTGRRWRNVSSVPTRDAGGPVAEGQPYLIGTGAQPELFVPRTAGTMIPNGAAGASTVNHIYVTQPLGTPDAIARAIDQALTARQRNTGARF